jgi:hypothetical protein
VDQAIQDGIGRGRIPDLDVPFIQQQLSDHEGGTEVVPIFEEFQEFPALFVKLRLLQNCAKIAKKQTLYQSFLISGERREPW